MVDVHLCLVSVTPLHCPDRHKDCRTTRRALDCSLLPSLTFSPDSHCRLALEPLKKFATHALRDVTSFDRKAQNGFAVPPAPLKPQGQLLTKHRLSYVLHSPVWRSSGRTLQTDYRKEH
jgi:hypothetical protein